MQNKTIFNLIKPEDNSIISEFNNYDLQELLYYINAYYLELRPNINLSELDTFGFELEVEMIIRSRIKKILSFYLKYKGWSTENDTTLNLGYEIASPVLFDKDELWLDVDNMCRILKQNANVWYNSSGHIHTGTQVLGGDVNSWKNFLIMWSSYENVIYRFLYGEYLTARESIAKYAKPLSGIFYDTYNKFKDCCYCDIKDIIYAIPKRYVVNFDNVKDYDNFLKKNTIEFRCANNSLNGVIWQNNTKFIISFIKYCKTNIDIFKIEKRRKLNGDIYDNLFLYDQLYLDQSIELCDMIFEENIDKIYFLRQYLKSFEIGNRNLQKAKRFTK